MRPRFRWNEAGSSFYVRNLFAAAVFAGAAFAPFLFATSAYLAPSVKAIVGFPIVWDLVLLMNGGLTVFLWALAIARCFPHMELGEHWVVLQNPLRRKEIRRHDVVEVSIKPPLTSGTPEQMALTRRTPEEERRRTIRIRLRNGHSVRASGMRDEVLYRITGILDPEHHPDKAAWVRHWFENRVK